MEHVERVKGPWSPEEDDMLRSLVQQRGARCWGRIANFIPGRTGKSCRLRWCNQLSPDIVHHPFTAEEDEIIIRMHAQLGNKWARIARMLHRRSDNAVKNHWNSTLRRRMAAAEGGDSLQEPDQRPTKSARSNGGRNSDTPSGSGSGSATGSGSGSDLFSTGGPVNEPQLGVPVYEPPFSGPAYVPQFDGPVYVPLYVTQIDGSAVYVPQLDVPVNEPELGVSTDLSLGVGRKEPVENNEPNPSPVLPTMPPPQQPQSPVLHTMPPPQQPAGDDNEAPPLFRAEFQETLQKMVLKEVRKLCVNGYRAYI